MDPQERRTSPLLWMTLVPALGIVLYPLSFPLACLLGRDLSPPDPRLEVVNAFYAPLNRFCEKVPAAKRAMGRYYYFWMEVAEPFL